MDRLAAFVHPCVNFFGSKRNIRRQKTRESIRNQSQNGSGRQNILFSVMTFGNASRSVSAILAQLDVIVAELPEECLDCFQSLRMIV